VRFACELNIPNAVVATTAKRLAVMELEPMAFGAAATVFVNKGASTLIVLVDSALDRGRYVA